MSARADARLRLGIAGVGIGALQVVPHLRELSNEIELTAIADVRPDNLAYFAGQYGAPLALLDSVEALCARDDVDAIWVATPNEFHARHTIAAAERGKHVICEKPMAIALDECRAMVEAVERNGVTYVQGHSKAHDLPVRAMAEIVRSGELGRPIHIQTWNYNDWLLRALAPNEVDTARGTGVVFRQGPHQIDAVRFIAGTPARSVRAIAGRWEPNFPDCEGNYTALLDFEGGLAATLVFDGYGYFDVTELTWGIGESGRRARNPESLIPRGRPAGPVSPDEKYAQVRGGNPYGYGPGGGIDPASPLRQPFFGLTLVSCERGVIRQSPDGVYVYDAGGRREVAIPPNRGRAAELLELYDAVVRGRPTALDARWGLATAEICLAILESSAGRREVVLQHQTAT